MEQFEFLLKATHAGTILQEDHNHWIDQRGTFKVRRMIQEFGRRLAESGAIEETNDVFYLTPDELRESASSLPNGDHRQSVIERKAEMDRFRSVRPPPALGTPPPGPPPDDPLGRAVGRFFGMPPAESSDPHLLSGNASSSGKVTGTAKVVLSLAEAGKVQPGDILVAPATMPAWTPLFATIAAVVTDAGGMLGPAVLGTGKATSVIKDGQTLEIDGDAGTVRIVTPSSSIAHRA